jgi:hypothetical protein
VTFVPHPRHLFPTFTHRKSRPLNCHRGPIFLAINAVLPAAILTLNSSKSFPGIKCDFSKLIIFFYSSSPRCYCRGNFDMTQISSAARNLWPRNVHTPRRLRVQSRCARDPLYPLPPPEKGSETTRGGQMLSPPLMWHITAGVNIYICPSFATLPPATS